MRLQRQIGGRENQILAVRRPAWPYVVAEVCGELLFYRTVLADDPQVVIARLV